MIYKTGSEGNNNYTKWDTEQKNMIQKYEDLLKTCVKKNGPLGKYQTIFNFLKKESLDKKIKLAYKPK